MIDVISEIEKHCDKVDKEYKQYLASPLHKAFFDETSTFETKCAIIMQLFPHANIEKRLKDEAVPRTIDHESVIYGYEGTIYEDELSAYHFIQTARKVQDFLNDHPYLDSERVYVKVNLHDYEDINRQHVREFEVVVASEDLETMEETKLRVIVDYYKHLAYDRKGYWMRSQDMLLTNINVLNYFHRVVNV